MNVSSELVCNIKRDEAELQLAAGIVSHDKKKMTDDRTLVTGRSKVAKIQAFNSSTHPLSLNPPS